MPGHFIVESESAIAVADAGQTALQLHPMARLARTDSAARRRLIDGTHGIHREIMLDVHEQQLLMLLFMIATELDARSEIGMLRRGHLGNHGQHAVVDMRAEVPPLGERRPPRPAALLARMKP